MGTGDRLQQRLDRRKSRSGGDDPLLTALFAALDLKRKSQDDAAAIVTTTATVQTEVSGGLGTIAVLIHDHLAPYLQSRTGTTPIPTSSTATATDLDDLVMSLDSLQQLASDLGILREKPTEEEEEKKSDEEKKGDNADDDAALPETKKNLRDYNPVVRCFSDRHNRDKREKKLQQQQQASTSESSTKQEEEATASPPMLAGAVPLERIVWLYGQRQEVKDSERGKRNRDTTAEEDAEAKEKKAANQRNIQQDSEVLKFYSGKFQEGRSFYTGEGMEDSAIEWSNFQENVRVNLPMALRFHEQPLKALSVRCLKSQGIIESSTVLTEEAGHAVYQCENAVYHATANVSFLDLTKTLHSGGNLSFQEQVSMLPVVALNPQPGEYVLDMCAAPGSKTLHVLDHMLKGCGQGGTALAKAWSQGGCLVINEKDSIKATHTLPARIKRYGAPNIIISQCDAAKFPRFQVNGSHKPVQFDSIVCDVPCSGDGTIRKDMGVFKSWTPTYVADLNPIQESILKRGVELLKPGGTIVYSTCSMNPAEDEQVVLKVMALGFLKHDLELVDVNAALQARGVVLHSKGGCILPASLTAEDMMCAKQVVRSYDQEILTSPEIRKELAAKVLRVFPHRDNTGGFFVAMLRKKLTAEPADVMTTKLSHWAGIKKYSRVHVDRDLEWKTVVDYYGLDDSKLRDLVSPAPGSSAAGHGGGSVATTNPDTIGGMIPMFHHSPTGQVNRIFIATQPVVKTLFSCELFKSPGVEAVTAGVRLFEKIDDKYMCSCPCRWRIASEGATWLAQYATKRIIRLKEDDPKTKRLILEASLGTDRLTQAELGDNASWNVKGGSETTTAELGEISVGSVLIALELSDSTAATQKEAIGDNDGSLSFPPSQTWWLTANLLPHRLELTTDSSIRRALLRILYDTHMAHRSNEE